MNLPPDHVLLGPASSMTILEMIREWRRGCSIGGMRAVSSKDRLHPERCEECTRALIEAIEKRVLQRGEV